MSARDHFLDEFARVAPLLPGAASGPLARIRREALEAFAAAGLPSQRDDDWRYTSLAVLEKEHFSAIGAPPVDTASVRLLVRELALADAYVIAFVNGRHEPQFSGPGVLPAGAAVGCFAEAISRGGPCAVELETRLAGRGAWPSGLAALNAAFMADGACIALAPGCVVERPIQILSIVTVPALALHLRHLVVAGEGSRGAVVEHYFGMPQTSYLVNVATDVAVGPGARIAHHRLQEESMRAIHIGATDARQQRGSLFASGSFAFGARLARADIGVVLEEEDATCELRGLYVAGGTQHVDHRTRIDHARPRGTSRQFYKGVVGGSARAVFSGKVIVHENAQKSDAHQSNRNLLLSENAEVDTRPQLEIYADDVKCSHGATVGQLDAEQLFYLRSRGVGMAQARALLTRAFAAEAFAGAVPSLRARLERRLEELSP